MSFILKLYKEVFFLTQEQAIVIIRIWYIIEQSTEPTLQRLKNGVFLLQILKTAVFFENICQEAKPPCIPSQPLKIKFRPPSEKSASCATVCRRNFK